MSLTFSKRKFDVARVRTIIETIAIACRFICPLMYVSRKFCQLVTSSLKIPRKVMRNLSVPFFSANKWHSGVIYPLQVPIYILVKFSNHRHVKFLLQKLISARFEPETWIQKQASYHSTNAPTYIEPTQETHARTHTRRDTHIIRKSSSVWNVSGPIIELTLHVVSVHVRV